MKSILARANNKLDSLILSVSKQGVDGRLLSVYRMFFSLVSLIVLKNLWSQYILLYSTSWHFKIIILVEVVLAILLFFNRANYLVRIVFFLSAVYLISGGFGVYNVEGKFFITASFWNIFFPFRNASIKENKPVPGWAVLLCFINISAYVFYGGAFTKLLDPTWLFGKGLYYTYALPWIKLPFLESLRNENLFVVLNYISMAIELSIFPLALFKRTRFLAFLGFSCFALFLMFGLLIQCIGWEGLYFIVLFSSLFTNTARKFVQIPLNRVQSISAKSLVIYMSFLITIATLDLFTLPYPYFHGHSCFVYSKDHNDSENPGVYTRLIKDLRYIVRPVNIWTMHIKVDILFTIQHLSGVYEYRVYGIDKDGNRKELLKLFNEDLTAHSETGGLFTSRWLQALMYGVSRYAHQAADNSVTENFSPSKRLQYLMQYIEDLYPDYHNYEIDVAPILLDAPSTGKWQRLIRVDDVNGDYLLYPIRKSDFRIHLGDERWIDYNCSN